jgi:ABC-type lipoprotein release transport system permease subunit
MEMYVILAWRNLWRNRNRTLITAASVFFAVILVLFMRSMQLGTYAHIIRNTVRLSTGYLQIQAMGFWEKQSLDNTFEPNKSLTQSVASLHHVTLLVPRFENFALASSGDQSRGVSIKGIDPELEKKMSSLSKHVQKGAYLAANSNGVLVGSKLADLLSVAIGDSLVVLGQGFHGLSAAGAFPIAGIVHLPVPELDSRAVFMTVGQAQQLFAAPGRVTSLAVMVDDPQQMPIVKKRIAGLIASDLVVKDWKEMMPELVQSIEFDNSGGLIMLGILYMIIAFGVFGTAMMMAAERRREFAILTSVGMKRWKMSAVVLIETVVIGIIGAAAGALAAIPLLLYFRGHPIHLSGKGAQAMLQYGFEPIMAFGVAADMFMHQAMVVLAICIVSSMYPIWSIGRFKIVNTLRA